AEGEVARDERQPQGHDRGDQGRQGEVARQRTEPHDLGDLLNDVALQTHTGVHGGGGEADHDHHREDDPHLQGDPEVVGELTDALDEVPGGTGRGRIEVAVQTVPFDLRC